MDQEADAGDDQQHDQRKLVEIDAELGREGAGGHPGGIALDVGNLVGRQTDELHRHVERIGEGSAVDPRAMAFTSALGKRLPSRPLMAAPASGSSGMIQR